MPTWFYAGTIYMLANFSNPLMLKFDSLWIHTVPAVLWIVLKKDGVRVAKIEQYTASDMVTQR